ncbi:hypothetical protein C8F01DRAFT_343371 [Mycena amicta]|nr:hypothetical protein C8F01DRAFT_343371 [Mycena amicta]
MEPISVTPSSSEAHQLVLAARLALPLVVTVLFAVLPSLFFGHNVTFVVSKIYWFGITAYASSSLATARDTHLRMGSLQLTCFTICVLTVLIAQLAKTIVQVEPPVWDLQWIWQSLVLCAATAFCDGWAWTCAGCLSSSHQALWARVSTPDLCSEASTLPYYLS